MKVFLPLILLVVLVESHPFLRWSSYFANPGILFNHNIDFTKVPYNVPPCINLVVGRPEIVGGPYSAYLADNPFLTLLNDQNRIMGYTSNTKTWIVTEGENLLQPLQTPIFADLGPGSAPNFDECGSWLNAAINHQADVIPAWYHAESLCDYNDGQTHKTIAYASSDNGGKTFNKTGYPNNIVISGSKFQPNVTSGAGDHTTVILGDYFYTFYWEYPNWKIAVARSEVSSGGLPGTWYKYYQGEFQSDGLGGDYTYLPDIVGSFVSVLNAIGNTSLVAVGTAQSGVRISVSMPESDDQIGIDWTIVSAPLLLTDMGSSPWNRVANSSELWAYPKLVPLDGGNELDDVFWLYCMYLFPGQNFGQRYIVRSLINLTVVTDQPFLSPTTNSDQAVLSQLPRYYNSKTGVYFETTSPVTTDFEFIGYIGLIMNQQPQSAPSILLVSCLSNGVWNTTFTVSDVECKATIPQGVISKPLGYIWAVPDETRSPLYRCVDNSKSYNYFVSLQPNCENLGFPVELLGFIIITPK